MDVWISGVKEMSRGFAYLGVCIHVHAENQLMVNLPLMAKVARDKLKNSLLARLGW